MTDNQKENWKLTLSNSTEQSPYRVADSRSAGREMCLQELENSRYTEPLNRSLYPDTICL